MMNEESLDGVIVTPLKQISLDKGDVYHGMKVSETAFNGFGESYYSFINHNEVKAWKLHSLMICNIVVPVGDVEFVLFDSRADSSTKGKIMKIILGTDNYSRITIPPGIWYGFKGLSQSENLVHNIASIEHCPEEQMSTPINSKDIPFNWE